MEQELTEITATREQLLQVYGGLQIKMDRVLDCIKDLKLRPVKTDILIMQGLVWEVGESSDDDKSVSENGEMLQPRNSTNGRLCTTYLTNHFYGDSD